MIWWGAERRLGVALDCSVGERKKLRLTLHTDLMEFLQDHCGVLELKLPSAASLVFQKCPGLLYNSWYIQSLAGRTLGQYWCQGFQDTPAETDWLLYVLQLEIWEQHFHSQHIIFFLLKTAGDTCFGTSLWLSEPLQWLTPVKAHRWIQSFRLLN